MPGKHYTKKGKGFRMMGMDFGNGSGMQRPNQTSNMQGNMSNPLMKVGSPDDYDEMKDSNQDQPKKETKLNQLTQRAEFDEGVNEKGYITKSKSGINLFGRKRNVTKYYDPETGEKLGKVVDVARGKGDPRPNKQKIKQVNPGVTQSSVVGKIRLDENIFGGKASKKQKGFLPSSSDSNINRAQRAAEIKDKNTTYDEKGNPRIPKYKEVFDKFEKKDGKYINPRSGEKYDNLDGFITDAEEWWDKQASPEETNNPKLKEQDQPYGLDEKGNVKFSQSPNKYGRKKTFAKKSKPYKMKRYKK